MLVDNGAKFFYKSICIYINIKSTVPRFKHGAQPVLVRNEYGFRFGLQKRASPRTIRQRRHGFKNNLRRTASALFRPPQLLQIATSVVLCCSHLWPQEKKHQLIWLVHVISLRYMYITPKIRTSYNWKFTRNSGGRPSKYALSICGQNGVKRICLAKFVITKES